MVLQLVQVWTYQPDLAKVLAHISRYLIELKHPLGQDATMWIDTTRKTVASHAK